MTREEASKHLFDDWYIENGRLCVDESNRDDFCKALGMGIKALRPVSREQVEKVFSGCPGCDSVSSKWEIKFCPFCGKPMTDEAVEMVMERLEALHDNRT